MDVLFHKLYTKIFAFSTKSSEGLEDLIPRRKGKQNVYQIVYTEKNDFSISPPTPIIVLMTEQIRNGSENLPRKKIEVITIPIRSEKLQRNTKKSTCRQD